MTQQEQSGNFPTVPRIYPFKPQFYIVKMGTTGEDFFFLFLLQNIDRRYLFEPPRQSSSNMYPQSML